MLHYETWGKGEPLVAVHGFTQTGRSWGELGRRLGEVNRVIAVDAPGHGLSSSLEAGLWESAGLIAEVGGEAVYLGYSMGARLVLHVALSRPQLVRRLVLISGSAGIDDPAERAARRRSDEQLAARVEAEGVERFVSWWLSLPMWATLPEASAEVESRLANTPAGLASSLRLAGAGAVDPPLWERLGELAMPVLVIAGERDEAYAARAERFGVAIRAATVAVIPGAGHACHLERPGVVGDVIAGWLAGSHSARPAVRRAPKSS